MGYILFYVEYWRWLSSLSTLEWRWNWITMVINVYLDEILINYVNISSVFILIVVITPVIFWYSNLHCLFSLLPISWIACFFGLRASVNSPLISNTHLNSRMCHLLFVLGSSLWHYRLCQFRCDYSDVFLTWLLINEFVGRQKSVTLSRTSALP